MAYHVNAVQELNEVSEALTTLGQLERAGPAGDAVRAAMEALSERQGQLIAQLAAAQAEPFILT